MIHFLKRFANIIHRRSRLISHGTIRSIKMEYISNTFHFWQSYKFGYCKVSSADIWKMLRIFKSISYLFTYYFLCTMSLLLKNVLKPFLIFLSTFLISAFDHIFKVTFPHFKIQRNYFCIRTNLKGGRKISYVCLKT